MLISIRVKLKVHSLSNIMLKKCYKVIIKLCCILNFTINSMVNILLIILNPDIFLQIKNNCICHQMNNCIKNYTYETVTRKK